MKGQTFHNFAAAMFDALPDRSVPPTDGPFYRGDVCKVNGLAMVWLHDAWHAIDEVNRRLKSVPIQLDCATILQTPPETQASPVAPDGP